MRLHGKEHRGEVAEEKRFEKKLAEGMKLPVEEKKAIVSWLREQYLLSEEFLPEVKPMEQCPADWPLGWKIALEKAITSFAKLSTSEGSDKLYAVREQATANLKNDSNENTKVDDHNN